MNETKCVAQAPAQQLNDIAGGIIDILSDACCKTVVVKDRLFINEPEKVAQSNPGEPCNLETRLRLIRALAQEINETLCMIQNRV